MDTTDHRSIMVGWRPSSESLETRRESTPAIGRAFRKKINAFILIMVLALIAVVAACAYVAISRHYQLTTDEGLQTEFTISQDLYSVCCTNNSSNSYNCSLNQCHSNARHVCIRVSAKLKSELASHVGTEYMIAGNISLKTPLMSLCRLLKERVDEETTLNDQCPPYINTKPVNCVAKAPYRTFDGSCNNLMQKDWGQSKTPYKRTIDPRYEDNQSKPRTKASDGHPLSSARRISTALNALANSTDLSTTLTHMHMLWGQFLDHDISLTPLTDRVDCCDEKYRNTEQCFSIEIPDDDPIWPGSLRTCMSLRRSRSIPAFKCGSKFQEQINDVTAWIDGSAIYGSSDEEADVLREYRGGRLKISDDELMPYQPPGASCGIPSNDSFRKCYRAGDSRANVWPGLAAIHTLFVREHNRIADQLSILTNISTAGQDELIYQEARKIVAAELQVITYQDYLPNVLGKNVMREYSLNLGEYKYKASVDARISNAFSTAAYRFGHAEIPFGTRPSDKNYNTTEYSHMSFEGMFNRPGLFHKYGPGCLLRGIVTEPSLSRSSRFSEAVRDRLFISSNGVGLDLAAINNQRGRDHGLAPYNEWREYCGLQRATSFNELHDHSIHFRETFRRLYSSVNDIDLYAGGITENPVASGASVGPTFACLLADQFSRLKFGDRYWFESLDSYQQAFSKQQIDQLRRISLASILCANTDTDEVPADIFKLSSDRVNCTSLPQIRLNDWLQF